MAKQPPTEIPDPSRYFNDAREWFAAVYIAPIAERVFFLTIAVLSVAIAGMSVVALMRLLPVVERVPIYVRTPGDIDVKVPQISPLRSRGEPMSLGFQRFYVLSYVTNRESYRAEDYLNNAAFVRAYSESSLYQKFLDSYSYTNPQSFAARLGEHGARTVEIEGLDIQASADGSGGQATVPFSVTTQGSAQDSQTRWTAHLTFRYSDIRVSTVTPKGSDEPSLKVEDPGFQVVSYEVSPR